MQKMSNREYAKYIGGISPKSRTFRNCCRAFLVGGGICLVGQVLLNFYLSMGLNRDDAGTAECVTLIFFSAVLTALSVYDDIAKFAGAGTLVPITGFANAVVSPAMEFRTEGLVLGMSANLFRIAGPVIAYGVSASVVYGVVYWITTVM